MTTIVYSGNVLAADSRATVNSLVRGIETDFTHDDIAKIFLHTGPEFVFKQDPPILASGWSGCMGLTAAVLDLLKTRALSEVIELMRTLGPVLAKNRSASALIVCRTQVIRMVIETDSLEVQTFDRTGDNNWTITMGSGGDHLEAFGVERKYSAVQLVAIAKVLDTGSGGPTQFVDLSHVPRTSSRNCKAAPQVYTIVKVPDTVQSREAAIESMSWLK